MQRYNLFHYNTCREFIPTGIHWKNPNKTELSIEQWMIENNICISITGGYPTKRDNWECDQWQVSIWRNWIKSRVVTSDFAIAEFQYFTGIGHRSKADRFNPPKAQTPHIAGIVYSLIMDAMGANQSFSDWCDCFGYSDDSIQALNIYQECEQTKRKLLKVFTQAQLNALEDLIQDY